MGTKLAPELIATRPATAPELKLRSDQLPSRYASIKDQRSAPMHADRLAFITAMTARVAEVVDEPMDAVVPTQKKITPTVERAVLCGRLRLLPSLIPSAHE